MLANQGLDQAENRVPNVGISVGSHREHELCRAGNRRVGQHGPGHQFTRSQRLIIEFRRYQKQSSIQATFRTLDASQPIDYPSRETEGRFFVALSNDVHAIRLAPGRFEILEIRALLDDDETDCLGLLTAVPHPAL